MTGLFQRVAAGFATVGPVGFAPVAPGTAGSLAGLFLFWGVRSTRSTWFEVVVLMVVIVAGVAAASAAESMYQRRDPGLVVIDEVAGMLVTLLAVPVGFSGALVGFCAFRLFDIAKPFPARQAERLPGGWGVMVDDLVAGVYAQGVLRLFLWLGAVL
ncbi:MAG: phosphatidylglycerophosphatase A [Vicinamibacterales bacterium]|jgi:phosphatidylglycerophosphatase A|nr:phosphatidylglycerophosphatase A [Vicinamibacterales bacterium]